MSNILLVDEFLYGILVHYCWVGIFILIYQLDKGKYKIFNNILARQRYKCFTKYQFRQLKVNDDHLPCLQGKGEYFII